MVWVPLVTGLAILLLWGGLRLAARRPLLHPWTFACVGGCAALALSTPAIERGDPLGIYALTASLGFGTIAALVEGIRRETGAAPARPAVLLCVVMGCIATGAICASFGPPRDRVVAGILVGIELFTALPALIHGPRRLSSGLMIAGIAAYGFARTATTIAVGMGFDVMTIFRVTDTIAMVLLGSGICVAAAGSLQRSAAGVPAQAA